MKKNIIKTLPVMAGYVFLGSAFGILVENQNLSIWTALFMSVFIYAGSMQFAAVPLLVNPISLIQTFILTLSINARHLFYGISMLKPFKNAGKKKHYMILIINENDTEMMFHIQLLNQLYWIIGTVFGYYFGQMIPFSTEGIEFSMTALFLVIFVDKFKDKKYDSTFLGLGMSFISLLLFGSQYFIIPAMIGIVIGLQLKGDKV